MKRTLGLFAVLLLLAAGLSWAATVTNPGGSSGGGGGGLSATAIDTSQELADILTDEIGSGRAVFGSSPTLTTPNLGTPSAVVLTNGTGLPISSGVSGLGTGVGTVLATPSSANLRSAITDETGTGQLVFGSSPTLTTPVLGVPSSINLVNATAMPATGLTGTVAIGNGGTGSTSFTGSRCIESNAGGTALVVAAAACGTGSGGGAASAVGASGAIQAANNSSNMADSGCSVGTFGRMTCPGGFVAGTSSLGVVTLLEGSATGAGAAAGEHNCWIDSTDGLLHCFKNGAASQATYVTTMTPATFWNKTFNTEATGNILSVVKRKFYPAAGVNGTTAGSVWDLPTSNPAVASAIQGTNVVKGVLNFASSSQLSAQMTDHLPSTWDGGQVDAVIAWIATPTTGTTIFSLQTVCTARLETDDPAFNATGANNTVTSTVAGTTLQVNYATIAGLTMTGCAPDETVHYKLMRSSGAPGGTMNATASFYWLEIWYRELLRKVAL